MIMVIANRVGASALVGMLLVSSALAAEPQPRQVSVTGDATVFVTPDEVAVNFGVEISNEALDKAQGEVEQRAKSLLNGIRGFNIPDDRIQVSQLTVTPIYRELKDGGGISGYRVQRRFTVVLNKEMDQLSKLTASAMANGANALDGIEFRSTENRKYRDEARRMAAKAAKEKATLLAGELGAKVGNVRSIEERQGYYGSYNPMIQNSRSFAGEEGGGGDGQMPTGKIAIKASVSVVFDLE
jgi:uncharacterized protein YggE